MLPISKRKIRLSTKNWSSRLFGSATARLRPAHLRRSSPARLTQASPTRPPALQPIATRKSTCRCPSLPPPELRPLPGQSPSQTPSNPSRSGSAGPGRAAPNRLHALRPIAIQKSTCRCPSPLRQNSVPFPDLLCFRLAGLRCDRPYGMRQAIRWGRSKVRVQQGRRSAHSSRSPPFFGSLLGPERTNIRLADSQKVRRNPLSSGPAPLPVRMAEELRPLHARRSNADSELSCPSTLH